MNFTTIRYSVEDRIGTIILNRPDRRNALNDVLIKDLTEALQIANRENHSRIIVITGAGSSFCAGMDLEYLQTFSSKSQEENLEDAKNLLKLLSLISTSRKPVVAAVNGPALGGGCGIAASCDFVFAAKDSAKLGVPEVRLGFVPAVILTFLMKRMGEGKAREFVLSGEILNAQNAKERGLVTDTIQDDKLLAEVNKFALDLASRTSPSSISLTKDLLNRMDEMSFKEAGDYAANLNALARKTDDFKKGVESFLKKEKLSW